MNVTINSSATELTFSHELLDTAYSLSLVLTREFNCDSVVLPISTAGASITNSSFVIDLVKFYGSGTLKTAFDDGVYKFTLIFNYPNPENVLEDISVTTTACFVVDYLLKCIMLNNNTPELLNKYRAMFFANDCDDCDCTHLCTIYNDLILPTTNGTTDCGCN